MNLVFDLAGVVLRWQPRQMLQRVLPARAPDDSAAAALAQTFFQGYEGDWAAFDRGVLSEDVLVPRIAQRTGLRLAEVDAVMAAIHHELQPQPETLHLLRGLRDAGHALHYLSNMPAPYAVHLLRTQTFWPWFRSGVFSCDVNLLKPEAAIFAHAARHFGLDGKGGVFVDDVLVNVDAARTHGWQGLQFFNAEQCAHELDQLLRDP